MFDTSSDSSINECRLIPDGMIPKRSDNYVESCLNQLLIFGIPMFTDHGTMTHHLALPE